jgi:prepilin-type N-terminal cleavage/methylation domain-containing protein
MSADRKIRRAGAAAAGFTLLEVVVALAIASFALVALFHAGSGGLAASDTAARIDEAVERAQSRLEVLARSGGIIPGWMTGDDGDGYRWEVQARPLGQRQGERPALYEVAVSISWRSGRHSRSVVLETRRLAAVPAAP